MASLRTDVADYHNNHIFTTTNRFEPSAEQSGTAHSRTAPHFIWVSQCFAYTLHVIRQQVGMALGNMKSSLATELDT